MVLATYLRQYYYNHYSSLIILQLQLITFINCEKNETYYYFKWIMKKIL